MILCFFLVFYLDPFQPVKTVKKDRSVLFIKSLKNEHFLVIYVSGEVVYYRGGDFKKISSVRVDSKELVGVSLSSDERELALLSADGALRILNLPRLKERGRFNVGEGLSFVLSYSPDHSSIGVGFLDGRVILYSPSTYRLAGELKGSGSKVTALAFSPDNLRIVSGYEDGSVVLWSTFNNMPVKSMKPHSGSVIGFEFSVKGDFLLSVGEEGAIRFWHSKDGTPVKIKDKNTQMMVEVRCEIPGGYESYSFSSESNMFLFGSREGRFQFLRIPSCERSDEFGFGVDGVTSFSFYKEGKFIVLGLDTGEVSLYRNPLFVAQYNKAMEMGEEFMASGKYNLAIIQFSQALSFYPEREAEEKLKRAKNLWDEKLEEDRRKMMERFRR